MSVTIKEVQSRKDLRDFVRFPIRLYRDCPHYVPNLYLDEMNALTDRNPMTRYSKTAKFLAYKDGILAGRVMAIINELGFDNTPDASAGKPDLNADKDDKHHEE